MLKSCLAASAATLILVAAGAASGAELIVNGDFSAGLSGWSTVGLVAATTPAGFSSCCGVVGSEPGYHNPLVEFGSGNTTDINILRQSFATVVGASYLFSFRAGAFGLNSQIVKASVGGITQDVLTPADNSSDTTFHGYSFGFIGSGHDTVSFRVDSFVDDNDSVVDDVSVIGPAFVPPGVPEPAAWAMMILGFGAVGSLLRRRVAAA